MKRIDKSKFIFYSKKELYNTLYFQEIYGSDGFVYLPKPIIAIICDYGYKVKYSLYHYCKTVYEEHEGIYDSICYLDYLIELVDDVCYVKNVFTNQTIKQYTSPQITEMISRAKKNTKYSHWTVPVLHFSFRIECDTIYCTKYGDFIFCIKFDIKNNKNICTFEEMRPNPKKISYKDEYDSDKNLCNYNNSICNDIGFLKHDLYMEIKQKIYQKLKKKINISANDFGLENREFKLDVNNYLSIIFYIKYYNNVYVLDHYVLEYDLTEKKIIHYYEITHKNYYDFAFNKDYLHVSYNDNHFIDHHHKIQRYQLHIYKRKVI